VLITNLTLPTTWTEGHTCFSKQDILGCTCALLFRDLPHHTLLRGSGGRAFACRLDGGTFCAPSGAPRGHAWLPARISRRRTWRTLRTNSSLPLRLRHGLNWRPARLPPHTLLFSIPGVRRTMFARCPDSTTRALPLAAPTAARLDGSSRTVHRGCPTPHLPFHGPTLPLQFPPHLSRWTPCMRVPTFLRVWMAFLGERRAAPRLARHHLSPERRRRAGRAAHGLRAHAARSAIFPRACAATRHHTRACLSHVACLSRARSFHRAHWPLRISLLARRRHLSSGHQPMSACAAYMVRLFGGQQWRRILRKRA